MDEKRFSNLFDEAQEKNITLPITQLVDEYYALLEKDGKQRWDTSALIENLRKQRINS